MSYNFNNNKLLQIDRNPGMWNGRNDIKKEQRSIQTKKINRIGTEVLTNMHRNENMFEDRMSNNINHYSKGSNIAGKKGDVNYGSNPYKIKNENINLGVLSQNEEKPLSRIPVREVNMHTNNVKPKKMSSDYYNHNTLKCIRDEYLKTNIEPNKILYNENHKQTKKDMKITKLQDRVNYSTHTNKTVSNNYNNNNRNNNSLPIQEKTNISIGSYKTNREYKQTTNIDTSNNIRNGTMLTNVMSSRHKTKYETQNKNNEFNLQLNRPTTNIHTNIKKNPNEVERDRQDVFLQSNRPTTNIHTNIKRNPNEVEQTRQDVFLQSNRPITNIHTNIKRNHNEIEKPRNDIQLGDALNLGGYSNNRIGLRQETKNLNYKL